MKYYCIVEHGDSSFECKDADEISPHAAELCAEDYHSNHDGWECTWPLTIGMKDLEDGPIMASFEVDREVVPQFHAIVRVKP